MPVEPHQPVSPMALIVVEPLPGEGGGVCGGVGGPVGSPLGGPAGEPLSVAWDAVRAAVGVVGVPPHHADARAQQTSSVEPSFRAALGDINFLLSPAGLP